MEQIKTIGIAIDPAGVKKGAAAAVSSFHAIATAAKKSFTDTAKSTSAATTSTSKFATAIARMVRGLRSGNAVQKQTADAAAKTARAISTGAAALIKYARNAKKASGENSDLARTLKRAAGAAAGLAAGAVGAQKLAAGMRYAIVTSAEFEQSLAELSAITGLAGGQLSQVSDAALRMGAQTQFSASQAAVAFKLVASAKSELASRPQELAGVVDQVLLLAQASGLDLPQSARIATATMNQFGLAADQAGKVANVLAAASKLTASEVNETGEALKTVGAVANSMGVSLEQSTAAIGALARENIKAGEAGTALRGILIRLETQADKNLRPSVVGLSTVLENLSRANLDAAGAKKLFGEEAFAAGKILVKNRAFFEEYTAGVTDTAVASEQAAIQTNTLVGDYKSLQSATEGLAIQIGDGLNGSLRALTQNLTAVVQTIAASDDEIAAFGAGARDVLFGAAQAALWVVNAGTNVYRVWLDVQDAFQRMFSATVTGLGTMQVSIKEFGLAGIESFRDLISTNDEWVNSILDSAQLIAPIIGGSFGVAVAAALEAREEIAEGLDGLADRQAAELEELRDAVALTAATMKAEGVANAEKYAHALKLQETVAKISAAVTKAHETEIKRAAAATREATVATVEATAATEQHVTVTAGLTDLTRRLKPTIEHVTRAHLAEAAAVTAAAAAAKAAADQRDLDRTLRDEVISLRALIHGYGKSEEALISIAKAQLIARGHSTDLIAEWERLKREALSLAEASETAAKSQQLFGDLAQAAMSTITNAGLDVWHGQIDSFGEFRDVVLAGLADIAAQMLAISATQWVLPESLGGAGGAFSGFGATDLGQLLGGLGATSSGGATATAGAGATAAGGATVAGTVAAAMPVIAAVAAAFLVQEATGGKLFGTSSRVTDQYATVELSEGSLQALVTTITESEGAFFSGTNRRESSSSVNEALLSDLEQYVVESQQRIADAARALGFDSATALADGFEGAWRVNVLGQDLSQALLTHLDSLSRGVVRDVAPGLELVREAGEDFIDTFLRLSDTAAAVNQAFIPMGVELENLITEDFAANVAEQFRAFTLNTSIDGSLFVADASLSPEWVEQMGTILSEQVGSAAGEVADWFADEANLIKAAQLAYLDALGDLNGGNERLTEMLQTFASHWTIATDSAVIAIESTIADLRSQTNQSAAGLGTSLGTFDDDFAAAREAGLAPEELNAWFQLGEQFALLLAYERELANLRGEALQYSTLTMEQQQAVDASVQVLNARFAELQIETELSAQALLNLNTYFQDHQDLTNRLVSIYSEFVPEADRNAAALANLQGSAASLGLDLSAGTEQVRQQFWAMYQAALAAGDPDLIARLDGIADALDGFLDDQEQQARDAEAQRQRAAEAAQRATEAFSEFSINIAELGLGIAYTESQTDALVAAFGSLDGALSQWRLAFDILYSDAEQAEIALARTGAALSGAGVDLGRLSDEGVGYFRAMLEQAQAAGDQVRAFELLGLVDELEDWVDAGSALANMAEQAAAETAAWAASIEAAQSRIAGLIVSVQDNGLNPTSQLDQIDRAMARIREALNGTVSATEEKRLNEELADLIVQRFELERQAIIENSELQLERENERIRRINEAAQDSYRQQVEAWRVIMQYSQSAAGWISSTANTGLAPVVELGNLQGQFEAMVASILEGGAPTGNITQSADQVLASAQQVYGASPEFFAIFESIKSRMADIAALASENDEPVEPPEIPLLTDISDNGALMREATIRIGNLQETTIAALRDVDDTIAELMEEEAERLVAHQAAQVAWWEAMQSSTEGSEDHINNVLNLQQQHWPAVQSMLDDIRRMLTTSGDFTGRIYYALEGGVNVEDELKAVQHQQLREMQAINHSVQSMHAGVSAAVWSVTSAVQGLDLSPTVNVTCTCGSAGGDGDPDLEAQNEAAKRARARYAYV